MDINSITIEELDQMIDDMPEESIPKKKKTYEVENITVTILEDFGPLSDRKNAPRFAHVDWNGYDRYDLRRWSSDGKPLKGISLKRGEVESIIAQKYDILSRFKTKEIRETIKLQKATVKFYDERIVLSSKKLYGTLWNLEINIVDWGVGKSCDIRRWNELHDRCTKGISLQSFEFEEAVNCMQKALANK